MPSVMTDTARTNRRSWPRTYLRINPDGTQTLVNTHCIYTPVTKIGEALKTVDQHEVETFAPLESIEKDPNGIGAHTPGAKLDAGKLRAGLVLDDFALALAAVTAVGTVGAAKYTPHGWLSVPDAQARYTDAQRRHDLALATGEANDPDTDLPHLAHAAWNALARLQLAMIDSEWSLEELQDTTRNTVVALERRAEQEKTRDAIAAASTAAHLYDEEHSA